MYVKITIYDEVDNFCKLEYTDNTEDIKEAADRLLSDLALEYDELDKYEFAVDRNKIR